MHPSMRLTTLPTLLGGLALSLLPATVNATDDASVDPKPGIHLTTVALRVHRMEAMVAFYEEAFGARFREVDTSGLRSQFGRVAGITLKLVPLRDAVEFDEFPSHQLGFEVPDVEAVIALAVKHGGRQEGELTRDGDTVHASVRDPDGNTIELYGSPRDGKP